jgi:signal transduction histidine kinase/CheY-like chemotaxis protein
VNRLLRDLFRFDTVELNRFERDVSERVVRFSAAYAALACALFGVGYWITGLVAFVPNNLLVALLMATIALRQPLNPVVSIFLMINLVLVLLAYEMVMLGGLAFAPAVWLIVPCVAALQIGMRRLGIYSLILSALLILTMLAGVKQGWIVPRVVMADHETVMAGSLIASQSLAVLLAFIILRARDRLLAEIRERNLQLAGALAQARSAQIEAERSRNEAMAARNEALAARNETLAAARSKEQFFANLTHEIRTPLNGILGASTLLDRSRPRTDQQPLIAALNASSRDLGEVVEAMLDHAKLSVGQLASETAPMRAADVVAAVRELLAARAAEKHLEFRAELAADAPEAVISDQAWLRRILINLVANAIKFTDQGTVGLRLRIEPAARTGATVAWTPGQAARLIAEVTDTGIGIPVDKIESVFEPFVQADPSITRRFGGTGLGLTISRRLAELLGGSLTVRSADGEGSVFTLTVPVTVADAPPPPPVAMPPSEPGRACVADGAVAGVQPAPMRRVLLVEDNAVNRLLANEMLILLGCEVTLAHDGWQAISLAGSRAFDIVLMDLQMPELDGIAASRSIRALEREQGRPPVPIVALTGNSASDYGEACIAAGMNGFLTKPVGLDALDDTLRSLGRTSAGHT